MQHASLHSFSEATTREGQIALVVLEGFSQLDLACVLEPLRHANTILGREFFKWRILSATGSQVRSSLGIELPVSGPLSDLAAEDILMVLAGPNPGKTETRLLHPVLRRENAHGRRLIGIYGGVLVLAQAGLLKGQDCALHWHLAPSLTVQSEEMHAQPIAYREGRISTAAGGTATADLMLSEIRHTLGSDIAAQAADLMAYHAARPADAAQTASVLTSASKRNPKLAQVIRMMERNLTTPASAADLAGSVGLCVRQLERLFAASLQTSPTSFYLSLRLNRARDMLHQTDLSVEQVAEATGFASPSHFSKRYRREFGISPYGSTRSRTPRTGKDAS